MQGENHGDAGNVDSELSVKSFLCSPFSVHFSGIVSITFDIVALGWHQ